MNHIRLTSSLALVLFCAPALCAQAPPDEHAGHHPAPAAAPAPPQAAPPAAGAASAPAAPGTPAMQDNMKRMQELMARINASSDPAERPKLLDEHSAAMRAQMRMMRGMHAGQSAPMGGDMMKNHMAMMGRMEMMESMMGQMMQHLDAMRAQKPGK